MRTTTRPCRSFTFGWLLLALGCGSSHPPGDGGTNDAHDALGDVLDTSADVPVDVLPDAAGSVCTHGTDCVLMPVSCCGQCGAYTREDIRSIHRDDLDTAPNPCDDNVGCPACYAESDPYLQPSCDDGSCSWMDLTDFDECESDDDCMLRVTECCECGAEFDSASLIAVNAAHASEVTSLLCAPDTPCDECLPSYEPYFTWCGADSSASPRRCRVDVVGP